MRIENRRVTFRKLIGLLLIGLGAITVLNCLLARGPTDVYGSTLKGLGAMGMGLVIYLRLLKEEAKPNFARRVKEPSQPPEPKKDETFQHSSEF